MLQLVGFGDVYIIHNHSTNRGVEDKPKVFAMKRPRRGNGRFQTRYVHEFDSLSTKYLSSTYQPFSKSAFAMSDTLCRDGGKVRT